MPNDNNLTKNSGWHAICKDSEDSEKAYFELLHTLMSDMLVCATNLLLL